MQYTDNYNLKLPQSTDAVCVEDFNENAEIIDGALAVLEISAVTAAEVWGGNSVPTSPTIDGALSKLAQTVPATMGTAGQVLTAGASEAGWGANFFYPQLIGEVAVNVTGNLDTLATIPVGWSTENLTGLAVRGTLTLVGKYNNDSDDEDSMVRMGEARLTPRIPFAETGTQDQSQVDTVSFSAIFTAVGSGEGTLSIGIPSQSASNSGVNVMFTCCSFTQSEGVATGLTEGGLLGFETSSSSDRVPAAASCTGTVQFYALRAVL